ncbi:signal peptidase complex-like protein DTM1 [Malania oleifera]|uniref:signal peptidase complex-like protein DTM1 n=1 Tax=Malania oleifera TaxID=397392 RepID=UPI0025AEA2A8|nr:signal peptidase complex-like protein DTM1 [Malania oleifera]
MANDALFRSSLVCLAVIVVFVGVCTHSFRKMMATYFLGLFAIAGVVLPDWDFFDRDFSKWFSPISLEERRSVSAQRIGLARYRIYPLRLIVYTTVYGFALYKWWMYVTK